MAGTRLLRRQHPLQPSHVASLGRGVGGQVASVHRLKQATQHLGGLVLIGSPHDPESDPTDTR
jgi:hypothetical protein